MLDDLMQGLASPARARHASERLRAMAQPALARMYVREERLFAFRVVPGPGPVGTTRQGLSRRYTAITLIGLAADGSEPSAVLGDHSLRDVCDRLVADLSRVEDLGEAALIAWAAHAVGHPGARSARQALERLRPAEGTRPTVESAWALAALTLGDEARDGALQTALAARVMAAFAPASGLFAHTVGPKSGGFRTHVCCFADLVYPIFALSLFATRTGSREALAMAEHCAARICERQGAAGQWWWHYDHRTGAVVEEYPVYAIHQDAMAPMALFALEEAGGSSRAAHVERGLAWLDASPELAGGSLVDASAGMIWRKVARREPRKAARYLQAAAAHLWQGLRAPGMDLIFPAGAVDWEDRPYHWGWLLYAWSATRLARGLRGASA
jgi:hypothetical protein